MHTKPSEVPPARRKRRAERLRRRANRLADDFSHDFRTPLTVVTEYLALLREGLEETLDSDQRRLFDVLADRVDDLAHTVNNMHDAVKFQTRTLGIAPKATTVAEILAPLRPSLVRKAAVKQIELQFDLAAAAAGSDLPKVCCDAEKIGRALINLTTHALKSCAEHGRVTLWARWDARRQEVMVGVSQQGQPVSPAQVVDVAQRLLGTEDVFGQGENPRAHADDFGARVEVAGDLIRLNLSELKARNTDDELNFWFGLPVPDPRQVVGRFLNQSTRAARRARPISFFRIAAERPIDSRLATETHSFLSMHLAPGDLSLQVEPPLWVIGVMRRVLDPVVFAERLEKEREVVNQNRIRRPLPVLAIEPLGTWRDSDDTDGVLETIGESFPAWDEVDRSLRGRGRACDELNRVGRGPSLSDDANPR